MGKYNKYKHQVEVINPFKNLELQLCFLWMSQPLPIKITVEPFNFLNLTYFRILFNFKKFLK